MLSRYIVSVVLMCMSFLSSSKSITISYPTHGFPPYTIANETGIIPEIISLALKGSSYKVDYVLLPAKRNEVAIEANRIDCRTKAKKWVTPPSAILVE